MTGIKEEGFFVLPPCVLSNHIARHLAPIDRKALRATCSGGRVVVNTDVEVCRVSGSHIARQAVTLRRVAASFPNVTALIMADTADDHVCGFLLTNFLAVGDEHEADAAACAALQALDVKRCHLLTASELQLLLLSCPNVRSLSAPRWTDASHMRALQPFTLLSELDLGDTISDITSITDKSLSCLPKLPALRALSLKRCIGITDAGIASLRSESLPALEHLDLTATRVTGASGFATLAGGGLRSLVLQSCRYFGSAGLAAVCTAHAGGLRSLQLCGTAIYPYGSSLQHLAAASGLERLDLGPSWEVDGAGLVALAGCPGLSELRLGNFNLRPPKPGYQAECDTAAGDAEVTRPPPLTPSRPSAFGDPAAVAAAVASPARCLPSLTRLSLGGMFGQHGLARLFPGLRGLTCLELCGLSTARDDVLALLARGGAAPALQELKLVSGGPDLTPAGLMKLAALPALQRLTLVACPGAKEETVRQLVDAVRNAGRRLRVEVAARK